MRFCGNCRTNLSAAAVAASGGQLSLAEWLEAKAEAGQHGYELLGVTGAATPQPPGLAPAPPATGGGATTIGLVARAVGTSTIALLVLERSGVGGPAVLGVDLTGALGSAVSEMLNRAAAVAAPTPRPAPAMPPAHAEPAPPGPPPAQPELPPPAPVVELEPPAPARPAPAWVRPAAIAGGGVAIVAIVAWLASSSAARREDQRLQAARDSARADSARLAAAARADSVAQATADSIARDSAARAQRQVVQAKPRPEPARPTNACGDAYGRGDWPAARAACAREAAGGHSGVAERTLGLLSERGLGGPQDYTAAANWYAKSVVHDDAIGQYRYALLLRDGKGIERDKTAALEFFQISARKGLADAEFEVGMAYANGEGTERSDTSAVHWFRRAADHGNARAKQELARRGIH
jgi:TPR repeat protein